MSDAREKTGAKGVYLLPGLSSPKEHVYELHISTGLDPRTGKYGKAQERFRVPIVNRQYSKALEAAAKRRDELKEKYRSPSGTGNVVGWTVDQMIEAYLDFVEGDLSDNTVRIDDHRFRVVKERWSKRKMRSITTKDVDLLLSSLAAERGWENSTYNRFRTFLQSVWNLADKWGVASKTVVSDSTRRREEEVDKEEIDPNWYLMILDNLSLKYTDYYELTFQLGCRASEGLSLKVSDWDQKKGIIWIRRARKRSRAGVESDGPTKGRKARFVEVPPSVKLILQRRLEILRDAKGAVRVDDYLFSDDGGLTPWPIGRASKEISRTMRRICPTPGCGYFMPKKPGNRSATANDCAICEVPLGISCTLQNLRSMSTSTLLASGVNPKYVQRRGGWSKADVMMRNYAYAMVEDASVAHNVLGTFSLGDSLSKASAN